MVVSVTEVPAGIFKDTKAVPGVKYDCFILILLSLINCYFRKEKRIKLLSLLIKSYKNILSDFRVEHLCQKVFSWIISTISSLLWNSFEVNLKCSIAGHKMNKKIWKLDKIGRGDTDLGLQYLSKSQSRSQFHVMLKHKISNKELVLALDCVKLKGHEW